MNLSPKTILFCLALCGCDGPLIVVHLDAKVKAPKIPAPEVETPEPPEEPERDRPPKAQAPAGEDSGTSGDTAEGDEDTGPEDTGDPHVGQEAIRDDGDSLRPVYPEQGGRPFQPLGC